MAIYVIGGTESPDLWEVDTERGTVRPLKVGTGAEDVDEESLGKIQTMRENGSSVVKGVNFAVSVTDGAGLTARQLTTRQLTTRQLTGNG